MVARDASCAGDSAWADGVWVAALLRGGYTLTCTQRLVWRRLEAVEDSFASSAVARFSVRV